MCSVRGIAQKRGNKLKRSSLRINVALAAVTELTPPFLVLSEPLSLLDSPALFKFDAASQAVSFTDCLVMTVADEYGTKDIFGFDKQFEDAGYQRLKPSTEGKQRD
jgi:predicted nucleic acid-binding protein